LSCEANIVGETLRKIEILRPALGNIAKDLLGLLECIAHGARSSRAHVPS
jgi:hypothetical protein